jgi:hypothetical protein
MPPLAYGWASFAELGEDFVPLFGIP